jgi:NADH:ubiquinone oxidoreductase subunit F (NADH-binding)
MACTALYPSLEAQSYKRRGDVWEIVSSSGLKGRFQGSGFQQALEWMLVVKHFPLVV